uniref:Uncharacterized protein n=1 Tax=Octactis speculum TaxID=3111310 RepID=A0A7S2F3N5_9STRA|mmetsp:Transcript_11112/g.14702  ORF Transcript_11112/g.14702 Transcript_11112/m.14702 type:complete len:223 (+) Transcript_11112:41-709(+)
MLRADKLLLQSNLRQNAIKLKEKEFNLHHDNFANVGTQSAVLAGFAVTALIEFQVPMGTPRLLQLAYYCCVMVSLSANLLCVANTTSLSVLGTGLALRGPDGAMVRAVEGLYEERKQVFLSFAIGLYMMLFAVFFGAWIIMENEAAVMSSSIIIFSLRRIYIHFRRISLKLKFEEDESVDFTDLLDTPLVNIIAQGTRRSQSTTRLDRVHLDSEERMGMIPV